MRAPPSPLRTTKDGYSDYVFDPAGTFRSGSDDKDALAHDLTIDPYFTSKFKVISRMGR